MIQHKFVSDVRHSGENVLNIFICIDSPLRETSLDHVADYLIELLPSVAQQVVMLEHDLYPFFFIWEDKHLSEKAFWDLFFDNQEDAAFVVQRYIDRLCELFPFENDMDLMFSTEKYYRAGSRAIFGYLERMRDTDALSNSENLALYHAFKRYLSCCDMDHEVYEDYFITLVLTGSVHFAGSESLYLDLLHFRLSVGQRSMPERSFEYLSTYVGTEFFKPLLDFHIDQCFASGSFVDSWFPEDYRILIASIYGSDPRSTNDVLRYIQERTGVEIPAISERRLLDIEKFSIQSDLYLAGLSSSTSWVLDTGLHRYDPNSKSWKDKSGV